MQSIIISISDQTLKLRPDQGQPVTYPVSTAKNGVGQQMGSGQTPLGKHTIRALIGRTQPVNAVFVGRRLTGEIYTPQLASEHPERDWILTRILWLCGAESGFNRGGGVDSMRRYIYIHGTPDSEPMGVPRSHGCIRMRNQDILDLFPRVSFGDMVTIQK